jgi:hypothetical protein
MDDGWILHVIETYGFLEIKIYKKIKHSFTQYLISQLFISDWTVLILHYIQFYTLEQYQPLILN